jgi:hypothetical protein
MQPFFTRKTKFFRDGINIKRKMGEKVGRHFQSGAQLYERKLDATSKVEPNSKK